MLSLSQIACLCGCGVMLPLSWIAYTHMNNEYGEMLFFTLDSLPNIDMVKCFL